MADHHHLQRFVDAQDDVYEQACDELHDGRKASHWMWFVFPQLRDLGHSPIAIRFGIASLAEARAYLAHPVLALNPSCGAARAVYLMPWPPPAALLVCGTAQTGRKSDLPHRSPP